MGKVGYCPSDETRRKIGDANRGRKKPEGWGDRHSEKLKENWKHRPRVLPSKYDNVLTKELLYDLYVVDKMPIRAVAKFCGCGHTVVRKFLLRYGIERRAHSCPKEFDKRVSANPAFYHKLVFDVWGRERRCSVCGSEEQIVIHHLNKDRYDNSKENLIVLCNSCHSRMHRVLEAFEKRLTTPTVEVEW